LVFLKFSNYVRIFAFSPCLIISELEMYAGVSGNHRLLWKQRGSQKNWGVDKVDVLQQFCWRT
jgi:hypothetical protein